MYSTKHIIKAIMFYMFYNHVTGKEDQVMMIRLVRN